ncbi:hypothetical protein K445DRAFT_188981 [Daldinia sp. EC12]|nr:hypothetical protein F4774DRAFT_428717 [Daldinia eschscholtzii]OTB19099.1 hypothetical protein K445DRAFT_188981 [Daldinia sp. EC12]
MSSYDSILLARLFNHFLTPPHTDSSHRASHKKRCVSEWIDDLFDHWHEFLFDDGEEFFSRPKEGAVRYRSAAYDEHIRQLREAACDCWFFSPRPGRWFCMLTCFLVFMPIYYAPYVTDAVLVSISRLLFISVIVAPPAIGGLYAHPPEIWEETKKALVRKGKRWAAYFISIIIGLVYLGKSARHCYQHLSKPTQN